MRSTVYLRSGDVWKDERRGTRGRQGQDSSRHAVRRRREGGPILGQPEALLTALCSNVPFPSRLTGFRYSPCTRSLRANTRDQGQGRSAPALMGLGGVGD